jgi:hypothetical protein
VTRPTARADLLVDHPQKRRGAAPAPAPPATWRWPTPPRSLLQLPNWASASSRRHRTRWWGYYYGMPGGGDGAGGRHPGGAPPAVGRARGAAPGGYVAMCALIAGVFPPYKTTDGDPHQPAVHVAAALAAADGGRAHPGRRRALHRPRSAPQGRRAVPPAAAPRRPAVHLRARSRRGSGRRRAPAQRRDLARRTAVAGGASVEVWATGRFHVAFCEGQTVVLYRGPEPSVPCPRGSLLGRDGRRGAGRSAAPPDAERRSAPRAPARGAA